MGGGSEEEQLVYRLIQEANRVATFTLITMCGYNGNKSAQQITLRKEMKQLTEEHSLERQLPPEACHNSWQKVHSLGFGKVSR